ncbi:MAG: hypothetical protein IJR13_03945 [Bacteroidales bacterium]|nr:hypothetical protein [Bacteroidales bacterium]
MKQQTKNILIFVACVAVLAVVACVFFSPVLQGKQLPQGDTQSVQGMVQENQNFTEATGEYSEWNSAMFSGMPNYQIGGGSPRKNLWRAPWDLLKLGYANDLGLLFLYLLGFFVALVCLGLGPWLSLFGAIAFGLGSYNLIIIEAGHLTKANCMALMMPILAGMLLTLRGCSEKRTQGRWNWWKIVGGGLLFAIALTIQLGCNHIQITYYTAIGCALIGIVYAVYAVKDKWIMPLAVAGVVLLVGAGIAVGCNARLLFISQEYAKYTMRGGSEITVTPENLYNDNEPKSDFTSTGLSLDYAYSWSYGIGETYTLLVPGAMGGGSAERVGKESAGYKNFHQTLMPLYWGDQPFTSGPVYFGAIVIFLFIFGMFVVRGPERWWLVAAAVVSILLSWGRHFMVLNEWLFYHLPLYNMFRTPSMALVLANVAMVFMAVLALKAVVDNQQQPARERRSFNVALYVSAGITGGILLIGLLLCGGFSFVGVGDEQMAAQYGDQWPFIQNVFIQDRKSLFVSDSWRSLLFVALAAVVLWLYLNDKIRRAYLLIVPLALLVLVDLWGVDRRYISKDKFVRARDLKLQPEVWDAAIDQQAAAFGDKDYRVLNLAVNTFNDAKPSAFHHQIGGYSAVKMRRYQDIIDFYISRHINWKVLGMLNTRYVVAPNRQVQRNPEALGNAWFVSDVQMVPDADAEILALNSIEPSQTAVVDSAKWGALLKGFVPTASDSASIVAEHQEPYNPSYLRYRTHSDSDQLAVFSEVFYSPDWFAYIDGKPADYFRANYILRAMIVPAGDHLIEFRNEAPRMHNLDRITIISSILLYVIVFAALALFVIQYRKRSHLAKK